METSGQEEMRLLGPAPSHVEEFKMSLPLRDGHETPSWISRPKPFTEVLEKPLIVLFHGGGYTLGTEAHITPYARGLTSLFNAVVISATYRLALDHSFQIGPLHAYDALE